ncbi:MAG TPA: toll/interleukin-1 receptor domain-containing protein [Ktedonobacteraceae bacterium]|nr:toll/interleukin-1 receptor domain-containing protein [Ktedonobacteraceae bacterium]
MAVTVLLCYAHEDEPMVNHLKKHLKLLERNGHIALWDYGNISPGSEWEEEINKHLAEAQVILLLISASFLASEYCYSIEMQRAIQRHEHKEACVIPVILRPVHWNEPPIDKLKALPDHEKPISKWKPPDEGFTNAVDGVIKVIEQLNTHSLPDPKVERKEMIANLDQLIETVKLQMQPPPRALATANTLQQLSIFIPDDVTLADLVKGWRTLSYASKQEEEPATTQRRMTCGELAHIASQFMGGEGNLTQAIKTWQIWAEAFKKSGDPRQAAMANTFTRELTELQEAMH